MHEDHLHDPQQVQVRGCRVLMQKHSHDRKMPRMFGIVFVAGDGLFSFDDPAFYGLVARGQCRGLLR